MNTAYTNRFNLPLSIAVWLANDTYDHDDRPNAISATSLLKPTRQLVLSKRVAKEDSIPDVMNMWKSRLGSAVHDAIEQAWKTNARNNLMALNIPEKVAQRVHVNPEDKHDNIIPVHLEQRTEREVDGFIVTGKFDFIGEGRVEDFKTTSVYTYINKTNDEKYIYQGSIYRWLNPHLINRDEMAIIFMFTDWSPMRAKVEPKYPDTPILEYKLSLRSVNEVDNFIRGKLAEIKQYMDAPEELIPLCTDDDLWRKPPVWKYYSKPGATKATKVFDNPHEANARAALKGGYVVEVGGEVQACKYCDAFTVCTQKDQYIQSGDLKL